MHQLLKLEHSLALKPYVGDYDDDVCLFFISCSSASEVGTDQSLIKKKKKKKTLSVSPVLFTNTETSKRKKVDRLIDFIHIR